jgi:acetyl-CoA C-acetyltransferase
VHSHAKAQVEHWPEIVPVHGIGRDSFTRFLTYPQAARAKPITGTITAANAAVAADAAAFCLVVSDDLAMPQAMRILASATIGAVPDEPGLSPLPAIRAVWDGSPLARVEMMEAYAVQALACMDKAGIDPAITNLKGGALARGHPIGASGAILAVRLFHDLRAGEQGLAAIAAAGGIGSAIRFAR